MKTKKYLIAIFIGLVVFTAIHAVSAQSSGTVSSDQPLASCPSIIIQQGENLKNNFYSYIEAQAESAEPSSNRIGNIFDRYRDFQQDFSGLAGRNFLYSTDQTGSSTLQIACAAYYDQTMSLVQEVLVETYQQVLARKQFYVLNEKFDSILGQMDELQEEFHTSRSNLNQFHDEFSCFLTQCIQK